MLCRLTLIIVVSLIVCSGAGADENSLPTSLRQVAFDQHLNKQIPLNLMFKDECGRDVRLRDWFNQGRPIILVMGYFRCPQLCSEVSNGLVRAMLDLDLQLGTDFDVITVSIDARETPEMAAAKKRMYLERFGRPGAETGWHFLTGPQESIDALTKAIGFHFTYIAKYDQFAHASGIVVLTPEGKLSRYFYDVHYSPRDLQLGLVEASANRIGSPVDQILLYCFHYDPAEGRYGVAIMNFVRLGGVLTIIGIGGLMFWLWRGNRHRASGFQKIAR